MIMSTLARMGVRMPISKRRAAPAVGVALAVLLTATAGCAPRAHKPGEPAAAEYNVKRLEAPLEGFDISERSEVSGEIRSDFERAVELLGNDNFDEAIPLLEQVVASSPERTAPHINLALAYEHKDLSEKAEEQLKAALQLIPGHPVASNIYGLLLRKSGRFTEARDVFENSIKRFPEFMATRKNLGILCELYLDDIEAAIEQYQIYSDAMPEDEEVTVWIAGLRQRLDADN